MADLHNPRRKKYKLIPLKYSWDEANERRAKGLCMFCEERETPLHHLKHKNLTLVIVGGDDDDDQLSGDGFLNEKEISDRGSSTQDTKSSIGVLDENQVSETEPSIQKVDETDALPDEELSPKKTVMLDNLQETEAKDVMKPIQLEEMEDSVQDYESQKAIEPNVNTSSISQSQVLVSVLEPILRYNHSSRSVLEKLQDFTVRINLIQAGLECVIGQTGGVQLFEIMLMRKHKLQQNRKMNSPSKTWKFKYKCRIEKDYELGLTSPGSTLANELTFFMEDSFGKRTIQPYAKDFLRRAQLRHNISNNESVIKAIYKELKFRDEDKSFYGGKSILQTIRHIKELVAPNLIGVDVNIQDVVDALMLNMDGTVNKSELGANAILRVSFSVCRTGVRAKQMLLYTHIHELVGTKELVVSFSAFNEIKRGSHTRYNVARQEFMILSIRATSFSETFQRESGVYHTLQEMIKRLKLHDSTILDMACDGVTQLQQHDSNIWHRWKNKKTQMMRLCESPRQQGSHGGSTNLSKYYSTHDVGAKLTTKLREGESWKKVYGAVFVYLNIFLPEEYFPLLWDQAKKQRKTEEEQWLYNFTATNNFHTFDQRGCIHQDVSIDVIDVWFPMGHYAYMLASVFTWEVFQSPRPPETFKDIKEIHLMRFNGYAAQGLFRNYNVLLKKTLKGKDWWFKYKHRRGVFLLDLEVKVSPTGEICYSK